MKLAVHVVAFNGPGGTPAIAPTLAGVAAAAEAGGCTGITLMDHHFQMEAFAPATDPMLEGYTALGWLAAKTTTVTLGLLVTGVTYRHPGILAKQIATLDVLSGGRATLGIGAAWYDREHTGLGVPFPPLAERFERLEETLQICRQMWRGDQGPYEGAHYRLAETICSPLPLVPPRILIGGGGEKKTLRLVARYADACNLFGSSVDDVAHKLEVLERHCADEGRDPASIERTVLTMGDPFADLDAYLRAADGYGALGVTTLIVMPPADGAVAYVERLGAEVVPALAAI